jgi:hypothetical protein
MRPVTQFDAQSICHRVSSMLACGLILTIIAGCSPSDRSTDKSAASTARGSQPSASEQSPITSAEQLLERMSNVYRQASRYDDRAYVELSYRDGDQIATDRGDIAVSFVRPNQLTVRAYKATVACDGQRFRAWIRDDESANLDGQSIDRPAPAKLTLRDLFGDPLLAEQMSNAVLGDGAARTPIQLDMLLADDGIQLRPAAGKTATIAGEETVEGRPCHRVDLPTERGTVVLWIDTQSYLLRRMRFPRESLAGPLATAPELKDVSLTAHFRGATLDRQESGPLFAVESPRAKHRLRYFVAPPLPLPSQLFGQPVGEFSLPRIAAISSSAKDDPDTSQPVSRESLKGRTAVLLWFHDHPACEATLKQLNSVWGQFAKTPSDAGESPPVFCGVCTEPSAVSDRDIRELAARWNVELPLARDLAAHGRDLFQFAGSPALLVLNSQGVVQIVEVGANPNLEKELPLILQRLAKGEDIAAEVLRNDRRERARYVEELARATGDEDSTRVAPTAGQIYPATAPRAMRRELVWKSEQVKSPGDLVVLPGVKSAPDPKILVVDLPRGVVELDGAGKLLGRRDLALPTDAVIERIGGWRNESGEVWLACQLAKPARLVVYDPQGQPIAELPSSPREHALGDWEWWNEGNASGGSLQILMATSQGFARFDLTQRELVKQPKFAGSCRWLMVASTQDTDSKTTTDPRLWGGDAQGAPREWNRETGWANSQEIPGWELQQVVAAQRSTDEKIRFAALASNGRGRQALVALDGEFKEQWNYPLPQGTRTAESATLIRNRLHAIRLFRDQQPFWLLAADDASIHLISADGSFSDFMSEGVQVKGLGAVELQGESCVVVATANGLNCWKLEPPDSR